MNRIREIFSPADGWIRIAASVLLLTACANTRNPAAPNVPYRFPPGPPASELLLTNQFTELDQRFTAAQKAYASGAATETDLRIALREFYDSDPALEPKYDRWVATFPNSYVAHLARGIYYSEVGYRRRGVLSTEETPDSDLTAAHDAHDKAKTELATSMRLDPKPLFSYAFAIEVARSHGDLSEKRHLLDRANVIDPANFVARARYMSAIETRWGGNQQMMLAFLEECRKAKLSDDDMQLLESVIVEDQGWIHQFIDHDYTAAEAAYRKSGALGGDRQLGNLVVVLLEQNKFREAIELLTEELKNQPGDPALLTHRSSAYMNAGMPREAIADLRAAAQSGYSNAQNNLGVYYMEGVPGVLPADPNLGDQWFRQSAAQGNIEGKKNLEVIRQPVGYTCGEGKICLYSQKGELFLSE
jgi:TPR repeat protein